MMCVFSQSISLLISNCRVAVAEGIAKSKCLPFPFTAERGELHTPLLMQYFFKTGVSAHITQNGDVTLTNTSGRF